MYKVPPLEKGGEGDLAVLKDMAISKLDIAAKE
jgi:hypothetical protein